MSASLTGREIVAKRRHREQQELDDIVLAHMRVRGPGWVTAREVAVEVGYPWRVVAHSLLRLASGTEIEGRETEWVSHRHRVRTCQIYRFFGCQATYPSWLMPVAPVVVAGQGRVVRMLEG